MQKPVQPNGFSYVLGYHKLVKAAAGEYVVQRGDALERIARRHGTTAREIARLNGIKDPSRILIGQKLRLPVVTPRPAVPARPITPAPRPVPAAPAAPAPAAPAATNAPAWTPPPKPAGAPPLGYTNNNPGNIRDFGIKWEGLVPGTRKGEFAKFQSMDKGFRALARNVISWKTKHNFSTVEQGVGRHAPPSENNTSKYIQVIADRLGVKPGQAVDFADKPTVHKIVPAIAEQEIGPWYRQVDPAVISNAVESAFAGLKLPKKAP